MNPIAASAVALAVFAAPPLAHIDPLSGIDFVTITHPGNAPWMGNGTPDDRAIGRGGVDYEYRIGRFEVTTSQWVAFMNAARDRPANDAIPHVVVPSIWGAAGAAPQNGGQRWQVPAGNEMRAVGGVTWRTAAIYCNWLHNGMATTRDSFLSGVYDVSTFGYDGNIFTDQLARSPGARYFIPTWDEWLKAVHFDPHRFGENQPGYWLGPNTTDTIPAGGPPDQGFQANWREFAGWQSVSLGAYEQTSPWGLYDAAGATGEWTESVLQFSPELERYRIFDGSFWNHNSSGTLDLLRNHGGEFPSIPFWYHGLRIAALVPSPGACIPMAVAILWVARTRRRQRDERISTGSLGGCLCGITGSRCRTSSLRFRPMAV